ncbi:MAG: hypothetical protein SFU86_06520 [Pirellulaceae bacterium]|nr:hypothetical protein [Pirellulaceae bacterium]
MVAFQIPINAMYDEPTVGQVVGGMAILLGLLALLFASLGYVFLRKRPMAPASHSPRSNQEVPSRTRQSIQEFSIRPSQPERPEGPPWIFEANGELASPAYGFTMRSEPRRVESPERSDGHQIQLYRKTYLFSRPIAGILSVESFGEGYVSPGLAQRSPDGQFLLIVDGRNVWLFDLACNRYLHETINAEKHYFSTLSHEPCRGRTVSYTYSDYADRQPRTVSIEIGADGELEMPHEWIVAHQSKGGDHLGTPTHPNNTSGRAGGEADC